MKQAKPIRVKKKHVKNIEQKVQEFLTDLLFQNIVKQIKQITKQKINSRSDLIEAILKGRIQYNDGEFIGNFDAKTSKELKEIGAKFDSRTKTFKAELSQLPFDIQQSIGTSASLFRDLHNNIIAQIDSIDPKKAIETFSLETEYIRTLDDLDEQAYQSLKKDITIEPELSERGKKELVQKYNKSMKKPIRDFVEQEITKLRQDVKTNMERGFRADNLVETIQNRYNVTKNKASFLAEQETSLLTSQFRRQRYEDAGIQRYRWSTSKDERVRDSHEELQGKIFSWDNPPITDNLGNRNHPGEDFRCRCVAIPIIDEGIQ